MKSTHKSPHSLLLVALLVSTIIIPCCQGKDPWEESPRVVNIINFIRYTEPRDENITEDVLFRTVESQARDLSSKNLIGTYLLQYDALVDPRYQTLMKEEMERGCEVGGWWEITRPHVEAAGMQWRGRYPWDWHACVGFSVGYTPQERMILVDVYMEKFREVFGRYPKSVGSWFIDERTLGYMYEKYAIEASCVCRDQIGTDGYTLWGGYWNGGFYPSRLNAYMPAQTAAGCIPVPVFRMLGSDPIYQYDAGVGGAVQGVITLEPVYREGGGSRRWVDWFFDVFTSDPNLGYNYVQVGQENSFTWDLMKEGFVYQTTRLASLRDEGKVVVQTLGESGREFRRRYDLTPPTSFAAMSDSRGEDRRTLWFNSRFYRANLLWEGGKLRLRDIHLFDERLKSEYYDAPDSLPAFRFETLPLVDGCVWSSSEEMAGLYFEVEGFVGGEPQVRNGKDGSSLEVDWPSADGGGGFRLSFSESGLDIRSVGVKGEWRLDLRVSRVAKLPFTAVEPGRMEASHLGHPYTVSLSRGTIVHPGKGCALSIVPQEGRVHLRLGGESD